MGCIRMSANDPTSRDDWPAGFVNPNWYDPDQAEIADNADNSKTGRTLTLKTYVLQLDSWKTYDDLFHRFQLEELSDRLMSHVRDHKARGLLAPTNLTPGSSILTAPTVRMRAGEPAEIRLLESNTATPRGIVLVARTLPRDRTKIQVLVQGTVNVPDSIPDGYRPACWSANGRLDTNGSWNIMLAQSEFPEKPILVLCSGSANEDERIRAGTTEDG